MNILIVTGGSSSERKISLLSARMVRAALEANGHAVTVFDFKKGYAALARIAGRFDAVFPVMHGKEGEDGTLYQFFRSLKRPYVGSDPKGASIAFDKVMFKRYCGRKGIATADWKIVKNANDIRKFGFPSVLKAANGGSSHEVTILNSPADLGRAKAKKILSLADTLFVEKLLLGTEITVGVLLGETLPVLEIVPPENGWFDYKNKYSGASKEIPFAPSVSAAAQRLAQKIALRVHEGLRLGSYSRSDFIVRRGIPYILEVNTPGGVGLTPQSLLPKAARAIGIPFEALVEKMLEGAAGRRAI